MIKQKKKHFTKLSQKEEDELAVRKMQQIDAEIRAGRRKLLTEEEMLAKYPELKPKPKRKPSTKQK